MKTTARTKYPFTGKSMAGRVVKFIENGKGYIISDPTGIYTIGYFSKGWFMEVFTRIHNENVIGGDIL